MNCLMKRLWGEPASMAVVAVASKHGSGGGRQRACLLSFFCFLSLSLPGEVAALIAKRHHCRFATVGSKSGSEGGF